jgi:hypothetical protein
VIDWTDRALMVLAHRVVPAATLAGPAEARRRRPALVYGVLPAVMRAGPDERHRYPTTLVQGVLPAVMASGTRVVGRGWFALTVHPT